MTQLRYTCIVLLFGIHSDPCVKYSGDFVEYIIIGKVNTSISRTKPAFDQLKVNFLKLVSLYYIYKKSYFKNIQNSLNLISLLLTAFLTKKTKDHPKTLIKFNGLKPFSVLFKAFPNCKTFRFSCYQDINDKNLLL